MSSLTFLGTPGFVEGLPKVKARFGTPGPISATSTQTGFAEVDTTMPP